MGKVAAVVRVMPQDPEVGLDALEDRLADSLPEGAEIRAVDREDVAFGLIALVVTAVVPDEAGGTEAIEEGFGRVEGVESVSVESVSLI